MEITARETPTISVIGLGKIGSCLTAVYASKGYKVIGVDLNKKIVKKINQATAPTFEPDLEGLLKNNQERITATSSYHEAVIKSNITFIIVPTPSDKNGAFSTQYIEKTCSEIAKILAKKYEYHLFVITSTVLPNDTLEKILPVLENKSGKKCGMHFGLCYSPLFIALGNVINNILNPDIVLIGEYDKKSGDKLQEFYQNIVDNKPLFRRTNIVNAEIIKISVNSYITTKISFANMLSQICEKIPGADIDTVTSAVGSDSRIGSRYLSGGLGFGGPCFPRDNSALGSIAKSLGVSTPISETTDLFNREIPNNIVNRILEKDKNISKVAILGLAYKINTAVIEESQGMQLAQKFTALNKKVTAYDPLIKSLPSNYKITLASSVSKCIEGADAIIIALPYKEFILTDNHLSKKDHPIVFDSWRILDPRVFKGKITYLAVGKKEDNLFNYHNLIQQKIIVCGAGGFIGGHMVKNLLEEGYKNIHAVDIKPLNQWHQKFKASRNFMLDLRDKNACFKTLNEASVVYNFAADMGGMGFIESNRAKCMINTLINTHLLQAAQVHNVKRYFFASSACVYSTLKQQSPDVSGLKEEDAYPAMPEDGYGWEKLFAERMCKNFLEDFGLQTRIARFHNIYGPFGFFIGGREKAPAAICRKVAEAKLSGSNIIEIWGDGKQTRSFTFIDDCIKGVQLITSGDFTEPVNLGSSQKVTIDQLVDIVENIAETSLKRVYNPEAPRGVSGRNSDNALIRSLYRWEPDTKLEDGLTITYRWIYNQLQKKYKRRNKHTQISFKKPASDIKNPSSLSA